MRQINNLNKFDIIPLKGGVARRIRNNVWLLDGKSHAQGGIDLDPIGFKNVEAQGGEIVSTDGNTGRVYSDEKILGGISPAKAVLAGANMDKTFKAQERFKQVNHLNDDGTKKAKLGTEEEEMHIDLPEGVVTPKPWQNDFHANFATHPIRNGLINDIKFHAGQYRVEHAENIQAERLKNMTPAERKAFFSDRKNYTKDLEKIFNDQDNYFLAVDANDPVKRVYDAWVAAGRPKITGDSSIINKFTDTGRLNYLPIINKTYNTDNIEDIISELSHPIQLKYDKGYNKINLPKDVLKSIVGTMNGHEVQYNNPNHFEYRTHSIIEPTLRAYIYDKGTNRFVREMKYGGKVNVDISTGERIRTKTNATTSTNKHIAVLGLDVERYNNDREYRRQFLAQLAAEQRAKNKKNNKTKGSYNSPIFADNEERIAASEQGKMDRVNKQIADKERITNGVKEGVKFIAENTPIIGDVITLKDAYDDYNQGNYLTAGIGLGSLFLPAGLSKIAKKIVPKISKYVNKNTEKLLNWDGYSKGGDISIEHLKEYADIERKAKANGTWLKNADGTDFTDDPHIWVKMQSKDFKKNYADRILYSGTSKSREIKADYNGLQFASDEPNRAITYANNDDYVETLAIEKGTPLIVFDANNSNWRGISKDANGKVNSTNDFADSLPYGEYGDIQRVHDFGPKVDTKVHKQSKYYSEEDTKKFYDYMDGVPTDQANTFVFAPGSIRKDIKYNNGDFDPNINNKYMSIMTPIIGFGTIGTLLSNETKDTKAIGGKIKKKAKIGTENNVQGAITAANILYRPRFYRDPDDIFERGSDIDLPEVVVTAPAIKKSLKSGVDGSALVNEANKDYYTFGYNSPNQVEGYENDINKSGINFGSNVLKNTLIDRFNIDLPEVIVTAPAIKKDSADITDTNQSPVKTSQSATSAPATNKTSASITNEENLDNISTNKETVPQYRVGDQNNRKFNTTIKPTKPIRNGKKNDDILADVTVNGQEKTSNGYNVIRNPKVNNNTSSFKTFLKDNASDIIETGANILGSIGSYFINRHAINNMQAPSNPIPKYATKLKTRINIKPQLDSMRETIAAYNRVNNNSTTSSAIANNRFNRTNVAGLLQTNQLYGQKENAETELINKDRLNQQAVHHTNVDTYNQYRKDLTDFNNRITDLKGENRNALISGINTAIQSTLTRRDKNRQYDLSYDLIRSMYPEVDKYIRNNTKLGKTKFQ